MNKEQGRSERNYRFVNAIFAALRDKGIITDAELVYGEDACRRIEE